MFNNYNTYQTPVCEVIEEKLERLLCSSAEGQTEDFNLENFSW